MQAVDKKRKSTPKSVRSSKSRNLDEFDKNIQSQPKLKTPLQPANIKKKIRRGIVKEPEIKPAMNQTKPELKSELKLNFKRATSAPLHSPSDTFRKKNTERISK
jgi:hypothetical protein